MGNHIGCAGARCSSTDTAPSAPPTPGAHDTAADHHASTTPTSINDDPKRNPSAFCPRPAVHTHAPRRATGMLSRPPPPVEPPRTSAADSIRATAAHPTAMHPRPPLPDEFVPLYDSQRAAILRRRAVLYSITILAIVALSWSMTLYEIAQGTAFSGGDSASSADILTDTLFTLIFGSALVYFARAVRPRAEVVRAFQWVLAVAGLTAVAVTPLVFNESVVPGATLARTPDAHFAQGFASLLTIFLIHALASVFVALAPREGLLPLVPIFIAFAAWVLAASHCTPAQEFILIASMPLAVLPGTLWGWWRHQSFTERFQARAYHTRYNEVSRELSEARRIHEALFPPPITRGPIRISYHYEPMREIGGDFLFVRPLAFPPSAPQGPILAVLIDVTGHGIAAAFAVNRLHAELETLCAHEHIPEPEDVIRALNTFTHTVLAPSAVFATAVAIKIDPAPTPRARWANAGHPPPYLRAPNHTLEPMPSTAPMLGVLPWDLFECEQGTADLAPGASILAYTDGLSEARNAQGAMLGLERIRDLIASAPEAGTIADTLARAVDEFRAPPPADDTLIVEIAIPEQG